MWCQLQHSRSVFSQTQGTHSGKASRRCARSDGGEIQVDESYFGGVRKGKRELGAAGKIPTLIIDYEYFNKLSANFTPNIQQFAVFIV